jgi:hypothetical protein
MSNIILMRFNDLVMLTNPLAILVMLTNLLVLANSSAMGFKTPVMLATPLAMGFKTPVMLANPSAMRVILVTLANRSILVILVTLANPSILSAKGFKTPVMQIIPVAPSNPSVMRVESQLPSSQTAFRPPRSHLLVALHNPARLQISSRLN